MKNLMLIAMMALSTTAFAEENSSKFEAYKQRRAERRAYALEARRRYNAAKGPHVYRTAIYMPAPISLLNIFETGQVRQTPIPMRPIVAYTYYQPVVVTARVPRHVRVIATDALAKN
jgi:hypothetical protein